MLGTNASVMQGVTRAATILAAGLFVLTGTIAAQAETRTLKLYHIHLREKSEITYKRNGKYLADGLKKANWALRDWRENKPTKIDPALLDIMWEAQRQSGTRDYIQVLGGYRSPKTNNMLRSRSKGVAGGSLHMKGQAIDFYMTDVPLRRLREIGLKMQVGGVGYYPRSGSPFVHFDSGNGRYWPRMSRGELAKIFPRGNTIYLPSDGKPLPGYEQAMASYNKRKGASGNIQIASASEARGGKKSLLARLFGGGADEAEDNAEMDAAPTPRRRAPEPAPKRQAPPAPAPEVLVASAPTPAPRRNLPAASLPSGLPMPERAEFATGSATPQPAAGLGASPVQEAVALASVPTPQAAPNRQANQQQSPSETTTVASILAEAREEPASAAGELAYAVPTPSRRPFAEVLQTANMQKPQDEAEPEADAIAETILSAASQTNVAQAAAALETPVAFPTPRSSVVTEASDPVVAEAETDAASADIAEEQKPVELAALDTQAAESSSVADLINAAGTPLAAAEDPAAQKPESEGDKARAIILASLQANQSSDSDLEDWAAIRESFASGKGDRVGASPDVPTRQDELRIASRIETASQLTQPIDQAMMGGSENISSDALVVNIPVPLPAQSKRN